MLVCLDSWLAYRRTPFPLHIYTQAQQQQPLPSLQALQEELKDLGYAFCRLRPVCSMSERWYMRMYV